MGNDELSLIRYNVLNFFSLVLSAQPFSPIATKLIKVVEALILSEPEKDAEKLARVKWIYENTHEKVDIALSIIELAVFKNLDRGLNREIDIKNKTFNLVELYKILDEITLELTRIVIETAKKYSVDLPIFSQFSKTSTQIQV
jgi:hypothetical protein